MEKNYQYLLNVTWDREMVNLDTVKKTLLKYFSLKKISEGGACECQNITGRNMIIGYEKKEARDRVLKRKTHEIKNDKDETILEVTVQLPDESNYAPPSTSNATAENAARAPPSSPHEDPSGAAEGHTEGDIGIKTKPSMGPEEYSPQSENMILYQTSDPSKRKIQHDDVTNSDSTGDVERSRSWPPNFRPEDKDDENFERVNNKMSKMDVGSSDRPGNGENRRSLDSEAGDPGSVTHPSSTMDSASGEDRSSLQGGGADNTVREDGGGHDQRYPEGDTWGEASSHNDTIHEAKNPGNGSDTNTSAHNMVVEPRPPLRLPKEIFISVTACLPADLYNKTLREKVAEKFPDLTVKETSDSTEMKGTFKQIQAVYNFLEQELRGPGEMPALPSSRQGEKSGQEMRADHVCVPSALCDYVMEVYQMKVQDMARQYKVKIIPEAREDGTTYIKFIPLGTSSSVEAAKEKFTEKVQHTMNDWSQETVDSSSTHLPFSEIKQCLRSQFSNILVIQEGKKIVLRGPKEELVQAKRCLEKGQYEPSHPLRNEPSHPLRNEPSHPLRNEPSHPPRPVSISTTRDMKNEIPVDARHLDILRKLKHQEICDLEKKYNVMLEEKQERNGSLVITFRPLNGSPELSPHAAHSFITLLQKTFFNIKKKVISVKAEVTQDQVCALEEQLKMGGVNVIMEYSKGSVVIIGHTNHVCFAEEMLTGPQKVGRAPAVAPPRGDTEEAMDTSDSSSSKKKTTEEEEDKCPICLCEIEDKVTFPKCKHAYCKPCLKELMSRKPVCAICGVASGEVRGNQPDGTMNWRTSSYSLPGFQGCGTIEISYNFPNGIQQENHPHPGRYYTGTSRTAYLPDNREGRDILRLLRKAFDQRLIFTVGDSRTTGATDTVTWNDVHHKTSTHGGPQSFGYPDPDYLNRVRDELKAKGVE